MVGQFRREDPEEDDDQREDGEDRPGIGDADLLGVEGGEGQKAGVAQQAEEQHGAGAEGRTVEQNPTFRFGWWFGRCSRRHDAGACGEHRESACEHPCRVVAEGLRDPLAERWPEEQRAVDRKREIARCLAPALVGGEILGSAGGADKHRCLAEPGERSEGDHHAEAGRRRRGDRGEAGDDRAADDEPLTAVSVSQWSDDWADARSGQSKRTDGDADLASVPPSSPSTNSGRTDKVMLRPRK